MKWAVYYDDGSSFTSDDGPPEEAPRDGVQVVAIADIDAGKQLWHSSDYYCWQDGEWVPRNAAGLHDYLRQPGKEKIVLQGRGIAHRRFVEIYRLAEADNRLGAKTARYAREPDPPTGAER